MYQRASRARTKRVSWRSYGSHSSHPEPLPAPFPRMYAFTDASKDMLVPHLVSFLVYPSVVWRGSESAQVLRIRIPFIGNLTRRGMMASQTRSRRTLSYDGDCMFQSKVGLTTNSRCGGVEKIQVSTNIHQASTFPHTSTHTIRRCCLYNINNTARLDQT